MKQPWIYSARLDGAFILAPALVVSAVLFLFRDTITPIEPIPLWLWGLLIIGVDVAHVYSTLFRTYADPKEFNARKTLYTLIPFVCWVVGVLLYSIDALVFWRSIAYLAVFHFVRQQYGLMMIYGRKEYNTHSFFRWVDKGAIYIATLYPLIYWHTHLPRHFDWFIEGDFFALNAPWLSRIALLFYVLIFLAYVVKEAWLTVNRRNFNVPKNILFIGTAISWWVGIITFDNDLAFTAANVLAHGIPYMGLIWIYGHNQGQLDPDRTLFGKITAKQLFTLRLLPLFVGVLIVLAYLEEGLWDGLIWVEHKNMFSPFHILPSIEDKATLAWLVPLLALPQLVHYTLDAFIWRFKTKGAEWKRILFFHNEAR